MELQIQSSCSLSIMARTVHASTWPRSALHKALHLVTMPTAQSSPPNASLNKMEGVPEDSRTSLECNLRPTHVLALHKNLSPGLRGRRMLKGSRNTTREGQSTISTHVIITRSVLLFPGTPGSFLVINCIREKSLGL